MYGSTDRNIFGQICKYLPFTTKNNRQKDNLGNSFFIFYLSSQNGQKLFLTWSKENNFF